MDRLHSCKLTQKLNDVRCRSDSRLRETSGHTKALPCFLSGDLPYSLSPQSAVRCQSWASGWEKAGLYTCGTNYAFTQSHRSSFPRSLGVSQSDFGGKPFIVFSFPFPCSHWHDRREVPKPEPPSLPDDLPVQNCQRSHQQTGAVSFSFG